MNTNGKKKKKRKNNRRYGNTEEVKSAKDFRDLGFPNCRTSREMSRKLDSCKVDLYGLPFLIQIKAGRQTPYIKEDAKLEELQEMQSLIDEHFPHLSELPKIFLRKKRGKPGRKRTEYDDFVMLTFEDFKKILKYKYDDER